MAEESVANDCSDATYLILRLLEHELDHHGFEDVVHLVLQPEEILLLLLLTSLRSTLVSLHIYTFGNTV